MFDKLTKRFKNVEANDEELTFKPWGEEVSQSAEPKESAEINETAEKKRTEGERSSSVELKVVRPESYDEVGSVADYLLDGCTVVLNVEALERATVLRMLDFLNGVTYCNEGEIKKVAQNTFIITPHSNVDISDM